MAGSWARAEHSEWEAPLKAVDESGNPGWPTDWQRPYAALRELERDEGRAEVLLSRILSRRACQISGLRCFAGHGPTSFPWTVNPQRAVE
ncbi:hypothetical protein [Streptomyces sp. NPDC020681]|uniref:hypothetical protein n=1 Tax=Streptomyces sp. NPDC020681 TaxID=3365083 RepID=UPI0037ACC315